MEKKFRDNVKKGISIVICTYNGKLRLPVTLQHLARQNHKCQTEIILVDNASTDGTKEFADKWWDENGITEIAYSSFTQPIPGKSYAQDMGYEHAQYEYLLVCDDDNWLSPNYVQDAFDIMESDAQIGALGGWCEAEFEVDKPVWFDEQARYFAVATQGAASGDITNKKGCLYGAGMVIRKSHWLELNTLGFNPLLTCRKGDTLSSGGDTEYSYVLRLLGYKMWFDDRLYFKHFMTKGRLNLHYVSRIRKAMVESDFINSAYLDEIANTPFSRGNALMKVFTSCTVDGFKNLKRLIRGSFEEKERAKKFFRTMYRYVFEYKLYSESRSSIKHWLPKR